MTKNEALQDLKNALHVSHSQIFTYLNCSLKYRFMYVEARPPERVSIALPFGSAIHGSLERYYRTIKEKGEREPLPVLQELFEHHINLELDKKEIPIVFKKETPDRNAVIEMGKPMLGAFHESVDLTGFEILEIERPLSARLYTEDGKPTDLKLIGVLDLVLKDESGRIIAVDNKTASKPYAQATVDDDNQLTCYAYLLAANRYVFPTAEVHCRFDVLRKLKTRSWSTITPSARPISAAGSPNWLRLFSGPLIEMCSFPSPPGCVRIAPTRMPVGRGEFR
jgi:putative RecB family exonuclease